jgi:hypothetical protein
MNNLRSVVAVSCSAAALLLVVAVNATPARAESLDPQTACTPDAFRLCSHLIPDADRIIACLAQKRASLSPACRLVFSKPRATTASASRKGD